MQEFQAHDDLSSAIAMLKRASSSTASRATGSGSCNGGGGDTPTAPCPIPEGYEKPSFDNPQMIDATVSKLMSAYSELFDVTNDYEAELLAQIRSELSYDDDVEEALKTIATSKPAAPTTKLGNKYQTKANAAAAKVTFASPAHEPPSSFLSLASSFRSVSQFLVCVIDAKTQMDLT